MKRVSRLEGVDASGDSVRVAYPLFYQVEGGGATPTSPLQLTLQEMSAAQAVRLNELWHSRLPLFGGMPRVCYGAIYDGLFYAVAIWSNPIARLLPQDTWLELRRLAIAPDAPKNTASRLLAVMTKLVAKKFPELTTLISYQDTEVHTGTIYKAAGWYNAAFNSSSYNWDESRFPAGVSPETKDKYNVLAKCYGVSRSGGDWIRPNLLSRALYKPSQTTAPKIRWQREL